ncbi:MAG: hypothetical protein JO291_08970 [Acidimicrobiia bacterium]|nr:hypothetical protein [Acidimicrobiia bacterium]
MDEVGRTASEKRVGDRARVRRAAIVIQQRKRFGRVKELQIEAEIRDVSVSGALLAVRSDAPLGIGQGCDLEISGDRGRAWVRRLASEGGELLCGVEFMDARPAFLPTVYQWLGRELDDSQMR